MWTAIAIIGSAIISGALSYMINQNTNQSNFDLNESNKEFNSAEAEKSRQYDKWKLENEIPIAYSQYRGIGMNENAAMMAAAGVSPSSGSSAQASSPSAIPQMPFDVSSFVPMLQEGISSFLDNKLKEKDIELKDQEIQWKPVINDSVVKSTIGNLRVNQKRLKLDQDQFDLSKKIAESTINKNKFEILDIQKKWDALKTQIQKELQEIENLKKQGNLIDAETENTQSDTILKGQMISESEAKVRNLDANTDKVKSETVGIKYDNCVKRFNAFLADNGISADYDYKSDPISAGQATAFGKVYAFGRKLDKFSFALNAVLNAENSELEKKGNYAKAYNLGMQYLGSSDFAKRYPHLSPYAKQFKGHESYNDFRSWFKKRYGF